MDIVVPAPAPLEPHPDRLLPPEPSQRAIARRLYGEVRDLPVLSPHGHVDPKLLLEDDAFTDPAALFVSPDHYVTRLLHADGVALDDLGVGRGTLPEAAARRAWRLLCEHWPVFQGTPVRFWLEAELAEIFGVTLRPSAETADALFDQIAGHLAEDAYRPRALYERFGISVLATTSDPCDDLADHTALAADPAWSGRVIPNFRPDRYLEPARADWVEAVRRLGESAGIDTGDYSGYLSALERRRRYFVERGATSADHAHLDARTDPLDAAEAQRIYRTALARESTIAEATAFRRHMLCEMARMSCEDGLVMSLHCGVRRDHHSATAARYGPDVGADIPIHIEMTEALRPLLERYGTHRGFHLVVFTVDETVWSRELGTPRGLLPVRVRRGAVVVPRRPRRHPAFPVRRDRNGGVLADLGVRG